MNSIGIDIGGSLIKICVNENGGCGDTLIDLLKSNPIGRSDDDLSILVSDTQKIHFALLETEKIGHAIGIIRSKELTGTKLVGKINISGGDFLLRLTIHYQVVHTSINLLPVILDLKLIKSTKWRHSSVDCISS